MQSLGKRRTSIFRFKGFDPNACHYPNKSLQHCHVMNEQEKKRAYNKSLNMGWTFCWLNMVRLHHCFCFNLWEYGRECCMYYSGLSDLLSEKHDLPILDTNKNMLALLKSSLLCSRGSRTVCRKVAECESDRFLNFKSCNSFCELIS